jgi:fructose/tagatose bisphosphate aldolase
LLVPIEHTIEPREELLGAVIGVKDDGDVVGSRDATDVALFSSHMIDLSEEPVDYNINTTAAYLKRAAPMKQWLALYQFYNSFFFF